MPSRHRPLRVTERMQDKALELVAEWMGRKYGMGTPIACNDCPGCRSAAADRIGAYACDNLTRGSVPTGSEAAGRAEGPQLIRDWDWPSSGPTPTILLEGIGGEWAYEASADEGLIEAFRKMDVMAEPYAGWSLCLYRI